MTVLECCSPSSIPMEPSEELQWLTAFGSTAVLIVGFALISAEEMRYSLQTFEVIVLVFFIAQVQIVNLLLSYCIVLFLLYAYLFKMDVEISRRLKRLSASDVATFLTEIIANSSNLIRISARKYAKQQPW